MIRRDVMRLVDGSFAVCDATTKAPTKAGLGWRYSDIQRNWYRVVRVLEYRGASLAGAEACARRAG